MPLVFVSHAAVDHEIARLFHDDIQRDFLGLCNVFASSNLDSLQAGEEWNQVIKRNLSECAVLVGLLSPVALQRGWVYAEFGAGWIRGIPTIPVCHSGLERGHLPAPISSFQGLNLCDPVHFEHLYSQIARAVGCQKPNLDYVAKIQAYDEISGKGRLKRLIKDWSRQVFEWNPNLLNNLNEKRVDEDVLIPANLDEAFKEFVREVVRRRYLVVEGAGFAIGTRIGHQATIYQISTGEKYEEYLELLT